MIFRVSFSSHFTVLLAWNFNLKCILQFEGNNLLAFCIDMYLLGDL
jgi:hypothetical protein